MARTKRRECESGIYHIIHRGVGRQLIFEDDADRIAFLHLIGKAFAEHGVELLCWCLMSNHFHMLVRAPLEEVSESMRVAVSEYARRFNGRHDRTGHLFQERFRSEPVESEEYLLTVVRYIHWNPVKAGIAAGCDYRWSSYPDYAGTRSPDDRPIAIADELVLGAFGSREELVHFHDTGSADGECMEADARRRISLSMPDEDALAVAEGVVGKRGLEGLKAMPKDERDGCLVKLSRAGLSVRQIERLTGIGRGIVQRACSQRVR